MVSLVRQLRNVRHESVLGRTEINDAVSRAVSDLEALGKADRKALYPQTPARG
jgi:hypothetical protein